MGAVYRARDPQLERDVAIKVLRSSREEARSQFSTVKTINLRDKSAKSGPDDLLHEARMMARISHPNIVPIYEVGLDANDVFVVMEHVEGSDLRAWLASTRTTAEILAVLAHAAQGLAAAHARGIVHGDFKPDNVLIGDDGRARVADFGLARMVAQPAGGLVRKQEQAGTPKYMAPELWQGASATMQSDTYAFATALVEAFGGDATKVDEVDRSLRERGVTGDVRALIKSALSERPQDRPDMSRIAAALGGGTGSRRIAATAIGVLALIATGLAVIFVVQRVGDSPACEPPAIANWSAARRSELQRSLASARDPDGVKRVLAAVGALVEDLRKTHVAACEAGQRNELTPAQTEQRTGCLERRGIELAMVIDAPVQQQLDKLEQKLNRVQGGATCTKLAVTVTAQPAQLAELYRRFLRSADIGPNADAIAELTKLAAEARAAGDRELEARSQVNIGVRQRVSDQFEEADETQQAAHSVAMQISAFDAAASALAERTLLAADRGDHGAAKAHGQNAVELAGREKIQPRTLMRVKLALGRTQIVSGEYRAAIETLRDGVAITEQSGHRNIDLELAVRNNLVEALTLSNERPNEAIDFALASLEYARRNVGEDDPALVRALDSVGKAYIVANQPAKAVEYRKQALDLAARLSPPEHSSVINARGEYAVSSLAAGDFETAQRELAAITELTEKNPAARRQYPFILSRFAEATFNAGRYDEGMQKFDDAIEKLAELQGADHPVTLDQRLAAAAHAVDLDQLDVAKRSIARIEQGYQRNPQPNDKRPAMLRGTVAAELALVSGNVRDAEAKARSALAELTERKASPCELRFPQYIHGRTLVELKRHDEAKRLLEAARAQTVKEGLPADRHAVIDLELAKIEYAEGKHEQAIELATAVRDTLAQFPGQPRARAEVERFLADHKK